MEQCVASDSNSECDGTCVCTANYVEEFEVCKGEYIVTASQYVLKHNSERLLIHQFHHALWVIVRDLSHSVVSLGFFGLEIKKSFLNMGLCERMIFHYIVYFLI